MSLLAILGASGHGKVIADAAMSTGLWTSVVFYDDAWPNKEYNGLIPILGDSESLVALAKKPDVFVAIGNNKIRLSKQNELEGKGFNIATVIHPRASVAGSALLAPGTVVMAGAVINSDAVLGKSCIVNTNAVVEHDCQLGNGVHISPNASLAGGVVVGETSWIGIGASVVQLISIGSNVIVGANAAVIRDVPDNQTVVGVPAKIIKR